MNMRRLLATEGGLSSTLSSDEHDMLLSGHIETINYESARELQAFHDTLQAVLAQSDALPQERTGQAVLRSLRSVRRLSSVPAPSFENVALGLADCTELESPQFTIQSAFEVVRPGKPIRFTRANASARTLEVTAATGGFGLDRWPSSETFIVGFNQSQASIGGVLTIPPHGQGAVLTLSVQLRIEQLLFGGGTTPGSGSSLLDTLKGHDNLPLRGTAVGWSRVGLSLHGAQGSARTSVEFVSEWVNRDGADSDDRAPSGRINLSNTVALSPETLTLSVFVDVTCFAGAEESEELLPAFALFECRDKPVTEANGTWIPPSRLRLHRVTARLCELPILVQTDLATGSV
jgi:hypothetical protein